MKVRDLVDRTDLTLVTDTQEMEHLFDHLGFCGDDFGGAFVRTEDGEFVEVWMFEGFVPGLDKVLTKFR